MAAHLHRNPEEKFRLTSRGRAEHRGSQQHARVFYDDKNMILEIFLRQLIHMRFWVGQRFSAAMTNVYLNNMSFRPEPKRQRRRSGGTCCPRFLEMPV